MHVITQAMAKVNLSLLIGPPDETGYHELFTVFAPIDVYDELELNLKAALTEGQSGDLHVNCHAVDGEANLVAQALRALERETGWFFSGRVVIDKGIPMGAGMGGGSTDAAVALQAGAMAIAEAGGPTLDDARLRILARTLGADVSFFLDPRPSIGRGIGEILEPLSLPEIPLVLIFPEEHLSTARVYRAFDANRSPESRESFVARADRAEMSWRDLAQAWDPVFTGDVIRAAAGMLRNDLEETSFSLVPELVFSKRALQEEGALGALMSGSGPTLFGVYPSAEAAAESAQKLAARGFRARAATVACGVTEGSWTAPDSVSLSS